MNETRRKPTTLVETIRIGIRIGISWCVQYCVNKDRDLLVWTVLCARIGIYCATVSTAFLLFQSADAEKVLLPSHSARCMHWPSHATFMITRWRRLNVP